MDKKEEKRIARALIFSSLWHLHKAKKAQGKLENLKEDVSIIDKAMSISDENERNLYLEEEYKSQRRRKIFSHTVVGLFFVGCGVNNPELLGNFWNIRPLDQYNLVIVGYIIAGLGIILWGIYGPVRLNRYFKISKK